MTKRITRSLLRMLFSGMILMGMLSLMLVTPTKAAEPIAVNQDEFWQLILDNDPQFILLIDNRPPSYYETAHIPGAINIPLQTESTDYLEQYVPDYADTKILIYCDCPYGQNAHYQGNQFISLGYDPSNVYYLSESFRNWKYAVISGPEPGDLPRPGESYQTLVNTGNSNDNMIESLLVAVGAIAIGVGALLLVSSLIPRSKSSKVKIGNRK